MEKGQDSQGESDQASVDSKTGPLGGSFLTVAEVASLMRVSKMTVYRLVHAGDLPAVRVGRSFRVPEEAVRRYLRDSFVEAG
jgi:excisionase family DNA binding protein